MLRYLIIEDEPPARSLLRAMLREQRPESVCAGEAGDGVAGLDLLRTTPADLLFLDIEFPPEGAFGLLRRARQEGLLPPPIVFVTAYSAHAVEAFRWAACDYLLKPVEPEHLGETLSRIQHPGRDPRVDALLERLASEVSATRVPERFTVTHKGRMKVLAWADVTHLRTENRLLFVHTSEGRFVLGRTLDELEPLLHPAFLRVHRSCLVALQAIREMAVEPGEPGLLILSDGAQVPISRERIPEVRRRLEGRG